MANSINMSYLERVQCNINASFLEQIYKWERPHLYSILPFSIWMMPFLEVFILL